MKRFVMSVCAGALAISAAGSAMATSHEAEVANEAVVEATDEPRVPDGWHDWVAVEMPCGQLSVSEHVKPDGNSVESVKVFRVQNAPVAFIHRAVSESAQADVYSVNAEGQWQYLTVPIGNELFEEAALTLVRGVVENADASLYFYEHKMCRVADETAKAAVKTGEVVSDVMAELERQTRLAEENLGRLDELLEGWMRDLIPPSLRLDLPSEN